MFSFTAPLVRSASKTKESGSTATVPVPWYDPGAAHGFLAAHGLAVRAVGAQHAVFSISCAMSSCYKEMEDPCLARALSLAGGAARGQVC